MELKSYTINSLAELPAGISPQVVQLTLWENGFLYDGKLCREYLLKVLIGLFKVLREEGFCELDVLGMVADALSFTYRR